jgi:hypothetical protein
MNVGGVIGLIMFVLGIALLVIWGTNTIQNTGYLLPGLILTGGGVVLLWLVGAKGK